MRNILPVGGGRCRPAQSAPVLHVFSGRGRQGWAGYDRVQRQAGTKTSGLGTPKCPMYRAAVYIFRLFFHAIQTFFAILRHKLDDLDRPPVRLPVLPDATQHSSARWRPHAHLVAPFPVLHETYLLKLVPIHFIPLLDIKRHRVRLRVGHQQHLARPARDLDRRPAAPVRDVIIQRRDERPARAQAGAVPRQDSEATELEEAGEPADCAGVGAVDRKEEMVRNGVLPAGRDRRRGGKGRLWSTRRYQLGRDMRVRTKVLLTRPSRLAS